jgi:hypothetical protein
MSFFTYLDNLRDKPDKEKNKIVLFTSLVLTIVIVFLWLSYYHISPLQENNSVGIITEGELLSSGETESKKEGFFGSVISNIILGAEEIKNMMFE